LGGEFDGMGCGGGGILAMVDGFFCRFMMGEAWIYLEMTDSQKNTIDLSKW
jgi:hypothetical protein